MTTRLDIKELVLGTARNHAVARLAPRRGGLSIFPLERDVAAPEAVALALRETLARTTRRAATDSVPFVCVTAEAPGVEVSVADDVAAEARVLTETRSATLPWSVEAKHADGERGEAQLEALVARVAEAGGTGDPERFFALLGSADLQPSDPSESERESQDEDERAFLEAHRRAHALRDQVRALDDAMTASVVPDWIWIATGFGGVGVVLTVVALLYPELRVVVLPGVVVLSTLGLLAYAWRSSKELEKRGRILAVRQAARAERERARAEVRVRAAALEARGRSPEKVLARSSAASEARGVPCVLSAAEVDAPFKERLSGLVSAGRQVIVFTPAGAEICAEALPHVEPVVFTPLEGAPSARGRAGV